MDSVFLCLTSSISLQIVFNIARGGGRNSSEALKTDEWRELNVS